MNAGGCLRLAVGLRGGQGPGGDATSERRTHARGFARAAKDRPATQVAPPARTHDPLRMPSGDAPGRGPRPR